MLGNKIFITLILIFLFGISVVHGDDPQKVEDFTLKDYNGKSYTLSDYKDAKAIVIMFIATRCPISNAYNPRMVKLYDDYVSKNVVFLGINSNKQEDADEVKEHAEENKFKFVVLKDPKNVIADKYDAEVTPEIYVVNSKLELLYHGRIDDSRREDDVESHDLKNALDEILAGKSVSVKETKAFGCTIKRID
jgi:peroxiredoxin